jgi:16S rRNA (uracil1498-N3)-methyltransferase
MARYDFRSQRLFVELALTEGATVPLEAAQANYLVNVLRLKAGASILVFNGRDGEWRAELAATGKKKVALNIVERSREQTAPGDLEYLFSPLKHARLDYMVQKAVEMGVARLVPIIMAHTQAERVNLGRMRANAIEAAEQCGVLNIPEVAEPRKFDSFAGGWKPDRLLIFCDEEADVKDPVAALSSARGGGLAGPLPVSVLVGPEGGFAEDERAALLKLPNVVRLALGPRILRADTAAVAALTLVQAVLGDWR